MHANELTVYPSSSSVVMCQGPCDLVVAPIPDFCVKGRQVEHRCESTGGKRGREAKATYPNHDFRSGISTGGCTRKDLCNFRSWAGVYMINGLAG